MKKRVDLRVSKCPKCGARIPIRSVLDMEIRASLGNTRYFIAVPVCPKCRAAKKSSTPQKGESHQEVLS